MYRLDQKAPANVAEPEELRSWDHQLHLTKILLVHGRKSMLAARDVTWHDIAIC
jgi:hypothetical protein